MRNTNLLENKLQLLNNLSTISVLNWSQIGICCSNQLLVNAVCHAVSMDHMLWYASFEGVSCVVLMSNNGLHSVITDMGLTDLLIFQYPYQCLASMLILRLSINIFQYLYDHNISVQLLSFIPRVTSL